MMFILVSLPVCTTLFANVVQTKIADLIQISPQDFHKPSAESIEDNINAKYSNKVGNLFDFLKDPGHESLQLYKASQLIF